MTVYMNNGQVFSLKRNSSLLPVKRCAIIDPYDLCVHVCLAHIHGGLPQVSVWWRHCLRLPPADRSSYHHEQVYLYTYSASLFKYICWCKQFAHSFHDKSFSTFDSLFFYTNADKWQSINGNSVPRPSRRDSFTSLWQRKPHFQAIM